MIKKIKKFSSAHKFISVLVVVIIVFGGYYAFGASKGATSAPKYIVQAAAQGTITSSVTGSGQVQAASQIDVKPQVSETVQKIYVKVGQQVAAGQLLMQLDTTNEVKAVAQARLSLQSAQLSLSKLQEAPATSTLVEDEDAVTQAEQALVTASTTLQKDYQDGFNTISGAFVDFQTVMTGMQDFVIGKEVNGLQNNPDAYVTLMPSYLKDATSPYRDKVIAEYQAALKAYQQNLSDFHAASARAGATSLDALFSETHTTAQMIGSAVKAGKDLMDFVVNSYPNNSGLTPLPSMTATFQANLGSYTGTVNADVTGILNAENTIVSDKTAITNDGLAIKEKTAALAQLQAGPDSLDVQSQQLSIQQAELSLQSAEAQLADDSIRAPIAGIVSAIPSTAGEMVASPAISIVSSGMVAQITLNEVDAAKMSLGDKATLTFDALNGITLPGQVAEIDPVGTVNQGVVNYNVQVGFSQSSNASSSDQIKPGMSVTASIITDTASDVIILPNLAVKNVGGKSYVLEPATPVDISTSTRRDGITLSAQPKMIPVTVGISNDTMTEIISGVNAGDQVIIQTITSGGTAGATDANSFRFLGGGGGGARGG